MPTPGPNKPSLAVLSPGAVGSFLAALFTKNGFPLTCICRRASLELIKKEGIRFESQSFGNFVFKPRVVSELDIEPDILFIATKATGLAEALRLANPEKLKKSVIVPMLNGLEHLGILRSVYGPRVIASNIGKLEVKRLAVNHVIHTTPSAHIELASDDPGLSGRVKEVSELINSMGITAKILVSEAQVIWNKLVRLNALACLTSVTDCPVGFVRSDMTWRNKLEDCVKEAAAVALAEGVTISPEMVMGQIDALPPGLGTSMQRDIHNGQPSELDAIAGAVLRAANRHGIKCPVIQVVVNELELKIRSKAKG